MTNTKVPFGYIPYISGQTTGFVLPVLGTGSSLFTETEGPLSDSDRIFFRVDRSEFIKMEPKSYYMSENEINYAVLIDPAYLIIGPCSFIEEIIRKDGQHLFNDLAIYLQICELFGSEKERVESIEEIGKLFSNTLSELTASRFINDAIPRSILWSYISQRIVVSASSEKRRFLRAQAVKNANFASSGLFSEALWNDLLPNLSISREQFVSEFQNEVSARNLKVERKPPVAERFGSLLRQVGHLGRQEQRIGRILAEFIEDPELTLNFVSKYRDRGQFANEALDTLEALARTRFDIERPDFFVASFVDKLYTLCFPMQRGTLLYDLAFALRHKSIVVDAIRARVEGSRSIYVMSAKSAIYDVLDARNTTIHADQNL
jgi:hypothetical protein